MSKRYRLVVFDWEGTLGDTFGSIFHLISVEAKRLHFGELDECKARQYVILGLPRALNKLFPDLNLHQHEQLLQAVQHAMAKTSLDVCLIPGALDIVRRLNQAGIDLAIATNKGQQSLTRALQLTGLHEYFKVARCAGQVPTKPCPQMLEEIIEEFDVSPQETLMIGDSVVDIEMACLAGVDAIGVSFECIQTNDLKMAGAIESFDDYEKLAHYLQLPMLKG